MKWGSMVGIGIILSPDIVIVKVNDNIFTEQKFICEKHMA